MTGGEQIVPQLVSTRFAHRAKEDGIVTEVIPNQTMTVTYKSGQTETIDILPRRSRTKRGAFVSLEMQPLFEGVKFKKDQLLASTKNFNNETSSYMSGKNVTIAVMSYLGYTYEDGYACSSHLAETTTTDTLKEVFIIIPPETKIFKLEKEFGKQTENGEDLIEFSYEEDLNTYLQANEFDVDDDDVETAISSKSHSITLKSPGGEIVDIKVYINDKIKSDKSLIDFHKELVARVTSIHNRLKKGKTNKFDELTASDNLDTSFYKVGGHKQKGQEFRGIKVSYLIKTPKPLRIGDKIAPRYGAKGLISTIFEEGSAYAENSGNIDLFISPVSILGRKNLAHVKEIYMGKLVKTLRERVATMLSNSKVTSESIVKLILDFYKLLCSEKTYKSVEHKFASIPTKNIKTFLESDNFHLNLILEPFHDVSFESILATAKLLKVELDEYVTIETPDGKKIKTDRPVPVGVSYFQFLEHEKCFIINK